MVLGLALHYFWLKKGGGQWPIPWLGGIVSAFGFGMMFWAWKLFHIQGTAVHPFEESSHFIQGGPYRLTRNPMYLGMTLILLGIALVAGTPPAFVAPAGFFVTIHLLFIPYEEEKMEKKFGAAYCDFKRRVRRWI